MQLSVIIVSYNVRPFLQQCLKAVEQAVRSLEAEIWVVDNASSDDSVEMVQSHFPSVKVIANTENLGFSKANNQAIRQATGEFLLLLNPDTVLEEDSLVRVVAFMELHPEAGGLGIKMIDGHGRFLPESKRGWPTPWASFCKMSGLSRLFPRSGFFNRYHLGYLDENAISPVEVLAGAFMFLRSKVLDSIGLLDEEFFMYGEDIDLSYRITKASFVNFYFPDARMIHYKGESTRKSSLNYVRLFYGAMLIFARKHFAGKNQKLLSLIILPGVYFRAAIAIFSRMFHSLTPTNLRISGRPNHAPSTPLQSGQPLRYSKNSVPEIVLIVANPIEAAKIEDLVFATTTAPVECLNVKSGNNPASPVTEAALTLLLIAIQENMLLYKPGRIVFSATDLSINLIITLLIKLKEFKVEFQISHSDLQLLIGTNFVCQPSR